MSMPRRFESLKGIEKAAGLLLTLPADESAKVLRCLEESYLERLTTRLLKPDELETEVLESILQEANALVNAEDYVNRGGVEYARSLLTDALGPARAEEIITKLLNKMSSQPFHYLADVEPVQLAQFLHTEHPQIVGLALSYLTAIQSAAILALLPEKMQAQVSLRLANMDSVDPNVVAQVEAAFRKRLSSVLDTETRTRTGGMDFLVKVLTQVDRTTERAIMGQLDQMEPDLATAIKQQMFVFESLTMLDDRSIQLVLRQVDNRDLSVALRGATPALREHVFKNMSQRASSTVQEEIENSPPVRMRTVEEAQQRIVDIVRRLEDEEEIMISRGADDALV
jgi:flagellar motor switch protein FliG